MIKYDSKTGVLSREEASYDISAVIVAKNEAHNLPRCLKSIQNLAKEIIVVINDSSDSTKEIAISFGAKVYEHEWLGFRDQKKLAVTYATKEWVFLIDADEEVSKELELSIKQFFDSKDEFIDGLSFPRRVWFLNRWIMHGEWYPDYSLRLFRKSKGEIKGSPAHDKIFVDGQVKILKGNLNHYSFPSLNSQISKITVFADFDLQEQIKRGLKWNIFRTIGRSFWRFFKGYIIKRGFLDGFPGFYAACFIVFSVFFKYSRLYEYEQNKKMNNNE